MYLALTSLVACSATGGGNPVVTATRVPDVSNTAVPATNQSRVSDSGARTNVVCANQPDCIPHTPAPTYPPKPAPDPYGAMQTSFNFNGTIYTITVSLNNGQTVTATSTDGDVFLVGTSQSSAQYWAVEFIRDAQNNVDLLAKKVSSPNQQSDRRYPNEVNPKEVGCVMAGAAGQNIGALFGSMVGAYAGTEVGAAIGSPLGPFGAIAFGVLGRSYGPTFGALLFGTFGAGLAYYACEASSSTPPPTMTAPPYNPGNTGGGGLPPPFDGGGPLTIPGGGQTIPNPIATDIFCPKSHVESVAMEPDGYIHRTPYDVAAPVCPP